MSRLLKSIPKRTIPIMLTRSLLAITALFLAVSSKPLVGQQSISAPPQGVAAPIEAQGEAAEPPSPSASSVEHWDKISLRDNALHADPPIPGEVDKYPEFSRELLRVQWRAADPIDLYIVRPTGVAKPPVILYLYGYPAEATRFLNDQLCKTVTRNGFAAVGFSSVLTGQRYHGVPMKEWFVSDLPQALTGTTHDVQMVLNFLAARGDFDMNRVGIFGEGSGGTIAMLAASVDPRIQAVDVLNPWGDWPDWLATSPLVPDAERPDYLKPDFLKLLAPLDTVGLLHRWGQTPLRVQQTLWNQPAALTVAMQRVADAIPQNAELARYKSQQEYAEKVGTNGKMLDWMGTKLNSHEQGPSGLRDTAATPSPK